MIENVLIAAASFEERSTFWPSRFVESGGDPGNVFLANVFEQGPEYDKNYRAMDKLGVTDLGPIDRFSSINLWRWVVEVVDRAGKLANELTIDITCMPRELLGMLLFAVAVNRECFDRIWVTYVSAPEKGYATLNEDLPEAERWLSKGAVSVRSIIGYPGEFRSERPCHFVVFAGHEFERILQLVEYVEPRRLTISGEIENSSIVPGAREISVRVVEELKTRIQVPTICSISFSSSSIDGVYWSLMNAELNCAEENVALSAMNTKLSFVGAALFALSNRAIRMIYAVPSEYNPSYCMGIGEGSRFEISQMIHEANV